MSNDENECSSTARPKPDDAVESQVNADLQARAASHEAAIRLLNLTDRQRELLVLVGEGIETSKSLARETKLSPATIDNHLSRAARVLGAKNRIEAARLFGDLNTVAPSVTPNGSPQDNPLEQLSKSEGQPQLSPVKSALLLMRGPPMGGVAPDMGWQKIALQVARVAFVGIVVLAALTLSILAFYKTFG
ncbi:helix-turn-helix transcriptional regulator [uncultured Novosphingobium sp.]|uniref:helix-turn-helix domain-containing protein n=1 Tax=uncultured Novosphingobium sp. TaxID=292277 RepID=UPI0025840DCA|nr:helix-turn-helix transcriptional regulator [uncultured Novosphingobium sp.]